MKTPETTREMLDLIDEFLAKGNNASRDLWDILSALRGPDSGENTLKEQTTVHIRAKAFPKISAKAKQQLIGIPASFVPTENFWVPVEFRGHFYSHIMYASDALEALDLREEKK